MSGWSGWTGQTDAVTGGREGPTARPWWTRNVKILSAVSLLQDAASELLYPILPLFLTGVLGAPAAVVGLIEGLAEAAASATRLVAGRLADRYPRRRLVGAGYGLAALGKLVIALAGAWPTVLVGRCVDRLGKGVRGPPRDSLLVEGIPAEARGRVFGVHRTADTAGAVIGPLAGLALVRAPGSPAARAAPGRRRARGGERAARARRPGAAEAPARPPRAAAAWGAARAGRRPAPVPAPARDGRGFRRVAAVLVAFGFVNVPDALVLLHLNQVGFGVAAVILAYVGYNLVYAGAKATRPACSSTGWGRGGCSEWAWCSSRSDTWAWRSAGPRGCRPCCWRRTGCSRRAPTGRGARG